MAFLYLPGHAPPTVTPRERQERHWFPALERSALRGTMGFLETGAVVTTWSQAVCSWRLVERDQGCHWTAPAVKVSQAASIEVTGEQARGAPGTNRCVRDAYGAVCGQRRADFYPEALLKSLLGPT